jgi:transketolase
MPKAIIADTVKGKGVSFMEHIAMGPEDDLYRYHSGAPDDEAYSRAAAELVEQANSSLAELGVDRLAVEEVDYEAPAAGGSVQRLIPAYSDALVRQAQRNRKIVALDGDLVLDTGLIPFRKSFPERFVECGIAEQDMVSQAGGMALNGLLPVVHSFACFLSARPNEQIYNNATEGTKIVYVGSLAGLLPGGPGHSHQCVRDISALAAVPGLVMLEPCNEAETRMAVDFCIDGADGSSYLRLTSVPAAVPFELPRDYRLSPGRGVALTEGDDAVIFGYGPILLTQAYLAAAALSERGVGLRVVNMPWLNRVDGPWLSETLAGCDRMLTLDNHYVAGGQGDMLISAAATSRLSRPPRAKKLGVQDIPACGTNDEVLRAHRLDADSLAIDILAFVREG